MVTKLRATNYLLLLLQANKTFLVIILKSLELNWRMLKAPPLIPLTYIYWYHYKDPTLRQRVVNMLKNMFEKALK